MKTFPIICLCLIAIAASASAADIAWVSFHGGDDTGNSPSGPAATAGFITAPDKGYTDLLIGAGHAINRITVPATGANAAIPADMLAELNAADLVIIGRSANSGSFEQGAETLSWNSDVTVPMIITSGFLTRDNRLAYFTGSDVDDITGPTRLLAASPAHPVFNGIALDVNNETTAVLDLVMSPVNGATQRGTSINTDPLVAGGTLIASATADNANTEVAGQPVIAEWPAGTPSNNAGETFSSKRMIFITGSREVDGVSGDTAGILDLSTIGQQMFLNAVAYMGGPAIPIIPGDTNGDTFVTIEDFEPIRANFRKSGMTREMGDLTGGGVVDFLDFRQWKTAFLSGGGSLAGVDLGFAASVPEPSTGALFVFALALLLGGRGARPKQ